MQSVPAVPVVRRASRPQRVATRSGSAWLAAGAAGAAAGALREAAAARCNCAPAAAAMRRGVAPRASPAPRGGSTARRKATVRRLRTRHAAACAARPSRLRPCRPARAAPRACLSRSAQSLSRTRSAAAAGIAIGCPARAVSTLL